MSIEINVQSFIINNSMYNMHVWSLGGNKKKEQRLDLNKKNMRRFIEHTVIVDVKALVVKPYNISQVKKTREFLASEVWTDLQGQLHRSKHSHQ